MTYLAKEAFYTKKTPISNSNQPLVTKKTIRTVLNLNDAQKTPRNLKINLKIERPLNRFSKMLAVGGRATLSQKYIIKALMFMNAENALFGLNHAVYLHLFSSIMKQLSPVVIKKSQNYFMLRHLLYYAEQSISLSVITAKIFQKEVRLGDEILRWGGNMAIAAPIYSKLSKKVKKIVGKKQDRVQLTYKTLNSNQYASYLTKTVKLEMLTEPFCGISDKIKVTLYRFKNTKKIFMHKKTEVSEQFVYDKLYNNMLNYLLPKNN